MAARRFTVSRPPAFHWRRNRKIGGNSEAEISVVGRDPALSELLRGKARAHFAAQRYEEAVGAAKQSVQQGPWGFYGWLDLAASQAQLGQLEEARLALHEAEARLGWTPTAAKLRQVCSYINPEVLDRWIDGLRKAGLKE